MRGIQAQISVVDLELQREVRQCTRVVDLVHPRTQNQAKEIKLT